MKIKDYIHGNRRGKQANRLEREAMGDPFLADALEGYEKQEDIDIRRIYDIRRGIRKRTTGRYTFIRNFSIAASVLLCIAFSTYVFVFMGETTSPRPVIGNEAYGKYLKENLIRPSDDSCKDARGEVTVAFHINPAGKPYRFTIKKPLCPSADKEAIRLIEEGPEWTLGNEEVTLGVEF